MGEMAFEPPPVPAIPQVPRLRDLVVDGFAWWNRLLYPDRRRMLVLIGWLVLPYLLWIAAKAILYVAGLALCLVLYVLAIPLDWATYHARFERAERRAVRATLAEYQDDFPG